MDRCKKNNLPCTFNEECFTPEEEPEKIVMNCLKCHYRHPDNGNCTAVGSLLSYDTGAACPCRKGRARKEHSGGRSSANVHWQQHMRVLRRKQNRM